MNGTPSRTATPAVPYAPGTPFAGLVGTPIPARTGVTGPALGGRTGQRGADQKMLVKPFQPLPIWREAE